MRWPQAPGYLVNAGLNVLLALFWAAWCVSRDYPWFFLLSIAVWILAAVMSTSKAYKDPAERGASKRITEWGQKSPPTRND